MIIFLYGPDTFRSQEKLKQLRTKFKNTVDPTASSMTQIEGNELDLAYVRKVVLAPALFAKERFVVFKNILQTKPTPELQEDIIALLEQYGQKENGNILVFWEGVGSEALPKTKKQSQLFHFLAKQDHVQEFKEPTQFKVKNWVQQQLTEHNCHMDQKTLFAFVNRVGTDMWQVNNELYKLLLYKEKGEITMHDIELLTSDTQDSSVYTLLDAVVEKNPQKAIRLFEQLCTQQGGEESIFSMLKWQLNVLAGIKMCMERGMQTDTQIAQELSLHQYVVKKNNAHAAGLSVATLRKHMRGMLRLEQALRSSRAPARVLLSRYLLSLAR